MILWVLEQVLHNLEFYTWSFTLFLSLLQTTTFWVAFFFFFFEVRSHGAGLAVLQLIKQIRLTPDSWQSSCLCATALKDTYISWNDVNILHAKYSPVQCKGCISSLSSKNKPGDISKIIHIYDFKIPNSKPGNTISLKSTFERSEEVQVVLPANKDVSG